jgi:hypothetical protein
MKSLFAVLTGYLLLLALSIGVLLLAVRLLGFEALLVPDEWRLRGWFGLLGLLLLMPIGLLAGRAVGQIGESMAAGWILAGVILLGGLAAGLTSIEREGDRAERSDVPKVTEMIRRVREPVWAMAAGPPLVAASVLFGCGIGVVGTWRRRRDTPPAGPVVIRDGARSRAM